MSPSSTSIRSSCLAFLADDTLVEVVPAFDLDRAVPLFSFGRKGPSSGEAASASAPTPTTTTTTNPKQTTVVPVGGGGGSPCCFGPVRAGIPVEVPLWLAALLGEKSLAKIAPPRWMDTDNLVQVLQEERRSSALVGGSAPKNLRASMDDIDDDANTTNADERTSRLPFYYYEITQRMIKLPASAVTGWNKSQVALLVEDICQVRVDKLRHTFQASMANLSGDAKAAMLRPKDGDDDNTRSGGAGAMNNAKPQLLPDTFADVSGMAATELALLGPFFLQALNDVSQTLEGRRPPRPAATATQKENRSDGNNDSRPAPSPRQEDPTTLSSASSPPRPPPRRRDRLRRFR